jgi:hypothetical protein
LHAQSLRERVFNSLARTSAFTVPNNRCSIISPHARDASELHPINLLPRCSQSAARYLHAVFRSATFPPRLSPSDSLILIIHVTETLQLAFPYADLEEDIPNPPLLKASFIKLHANHTWQVWSFFRKYIYNARLGTVLAGFGSVDRTSTPGSDFDGPWSDFDVNGGSEIWREPSFHLAPEASPLCIKIWAG